MTKSIKTTIPLKGLASGQASPKIEAFGFTGDSCQKATAGFIAALGGAASEESKPELYEQAEQSEQTQVDA